MKILYPKQSVSTLLQLVDQIYESFEDSKYTIGVFIDLFNTVDHNILLKKLETCGNRKQYIQFDDRQKQTMKL